MIKKCVVCGNEFEFDKAKSKVKCDACVEISKKDVLRTRVCKSCDCNFLGGPRAWYCPECRRNRTRVRVQMHKRNGPKRLLGSTDICQACGGEYVVEGGLQKYCKACADKEVKKTDAAQSLQYYHDTDYHETVRQPARSNSRVEQTCVVCGKSFSADNRTITCSPACRRIRTNENWRKADKIRKALQIVGEKELRIDES